MAAQNCDVLIVGGGPAGLAAAIALRMRGAAVTVADALVPPIDKACGEGLMPDALAQLAALGVELDEQAGAPFSGISFVEAKADDLRCGAVFRHGRGLGVRREALHLRLVERAREAGVQLAWRTRVGLSTYPKDSLTLNGSPCTYRYLVGADGQSSHVRKWAGLEKGTTFSRRFGFRNHFQVEPWSASVEVYWCALGQAYVTPVSPHEVCVAVVSRRSELRVEQVIDAIPVLRERLAKAKILDRERGAFTTTRRLMHVTCHNIALVGDASGSVDAVTGEGLAAGFRQAALLSEAIAADDLRIYAKQHHETLSRAQRMARILLRMDRHPALRRRAIQMLAERPALFQSMLGLHMGEETISRFVLRHGAEIGWRMAFSSIARI